VSSQVRPRGTSSDQTRRRIGAEQRAASASAEEFILQADSDLQPTLSVVMPTLNEEDGITECIERVKTAVRRLGVPTEIIVSDSSTDRTPEIARELGAIVVEPDRPGYGYAYRYAFERARGDFIVMGDADTTYDFEELPALVGELAASDADMVLGSRLDGEIKPGAMPALHEYVGNPMLTAFLNVFYRAGVSDGHSGFRVFTRESLEELDLESDGMEFASEMIMDASAKGLDIAEVPITYHEREGEATLDSFRDGWRHVKFMLTNAPGYLFSVPGAVLGILGTIIMGLAFFAVELSLPGSGAVHVGIRSMVAGSLLTIVGYQAATLGVFSTVASDPIRRPSDPLTNWLIEHVTVERGGLAGLALFGVGSAYAGLLLFDWVTAGYEALPALTHDVLAFTIIVLGLQTIFSSFFMCMIGEGEC
jgi:glycosyltransferase involved in cell wall biosynthesis